MRMPTAEESAKAWKDWEKANPEDARSQKDAPEAGNSNSQANPRQSAASLVVELALERYHFGVTEEGQPYAVKPGRHIVRLLRGGKSSLRAELSKAYFQKHKKAAPQQALADAMLVLEGEAQEQDPDRVHLRVATAGDSVYLDLGDTAETAVRINGKGWQIVTEDVPVLFRRTGLTGVMPLPSADYADHADHEYRQSQVDGGADIDLLWDQINVSEPDRPLVLAWLIAVIIDPDAAHAILALFGEQGSAKSTTSKRLIELVDPQSALLRKPPRDADQWVTAAQGSWVVGIDNMSQVPDWLSDSLCRAVTGDGDVRRALYTDSDLAVFAFRRCLILNGIDVGAMRGDLADRLLKIHADRIDETTRRTEEELDEQWQKTRPAIFAALLPICADVKRLLPSVRLGRSPRMADFARILAALDQLRGSNGSERYAEQAQSMAQDSLSAEALYTHLDAAQPDFIGHAAELLHLATPDTLGWRPPRGWPQGPRAVTSWLRRNAPAMRKGGWVVERSPKTAKGSSRGPSLILRRCVFLVGIVGMIGMIGKTRIAPYRKRNRRRLAGRTTPVEQKAAQLACTTSSHSNSATAPNVDRKEPRHDHVDGGPIACSP